MQRLGAWPMAAVGRKRRSTWEACVCGPLQRRVSAPCPNLPCLTAGYVSLVSFGRAECPRVRFEAEFRATG